MPYMLRAAALTNYANVARSVGLDPNKLLDDARLPRSCLRNPDMKISAGAVGRLLEASTRAAKIDDFGLRLAETRELSNLASFIHRAASIVQRASGVGRVDGGR